MNSFFLNREEIAMLTARTQKKRQIEALNRMGIPYRINAVGRPVVCRSHVEGRAETQSAQKRKWKSNAK